jgi:hypothetical protein
MDANNTEHLRMVNLGEACRLLGSITEVALRTWARRGAIRIVKIGGRVLVPLSEIERVHAGRCEAFPGSSKKGAHLHAR